MKSQFLKRVQPRANFLPQGYQVGQRVQPGQLLLNIAPLDDLWVTANFKETQLRHMHIGQEARIHVDAYNRTYSGSVASIGGATESRYSVLPPENATGNYVRIVQRIPVRIQIERGPSVPT